MLNIPKNILPLVSFLFRGGVGMSSSGKLCFGQRPGVVLEVPLVTSVLYLQLESLIVLYTIHLRSEVMHSEMQEVGLDTQC